MHNKPKILTVNELKRYQNKIKETTEIELNKIIEASNINLHQNKQDADNYELLVNESEKIEKSIKRLKIGRWFLLILIFPFILMTNKIKKQKPILAEKEQKILELRKKLEKQVAPFDIEITNNLIFNNIFNKIWDDCLIDLNFIHDSSYDLEEALKSQMLPTMSHEDVVGGRLFEHPFVLCNEKNQEWINKVYTNTVTVPYTTFINGKSYSNVEVVTGHVTEPAPIWTIDTKLYYHTSIAPKLFFTNNCSKKEYKKQSKKNQYNLENKDFNSVCKIIRNSEQDIRVIFTPLTQEQLFNLFNEQKYLIEKNGNITSILIEGKGKDFSNNYYSTYNYNIEKYKNNLINWCNMSFTNLVKYSLPVANMPVYYQYSSKSENKNIEYSNLHTEDITKFLCDSYNIKFKTDVIFKPMVNKKIKIKNINFNETKVIAHYFEPEHLTKIVNVPSIHRGIVPVPVDYIKYNSAIMPLYVLNSTNLKLNKELKYNNFLIHSGEICSIKSKPYTEKEIESFINLLNK